MSVENIGNPETITVVNLSEPILKKRVMNGKSALHKVSVADVLVDHAVNYRLDYDTPSMMEGLLRYRRIMEPLHLLRSKTADGKTFLTALRGNRRVTGGQAWLRNPDCPADLKKALEETECYIYEGLTDEEKDELVLDHGEQKGLSRVEVILGIWRQMDHYPHKSEADIGVKFFQQLASLSKNEQNRAKVNALPQNSPERRKTIFGWFHGMLGNQIMAAGNMGPLVREQYILSELSKLRPLTDEEKAKVKFELDNSRINLLTTAKGKDTGRGKNADPALAKGWDPIKGGIFFNEQIAKFIEEDKGPQTPKRTYSAKQMEKTADNRYSEGIRLSYLHCAGKLDDPDVSRIAEIDAECVRRDKVFDTLTQLRQHVKDEGVKTLIGAILYKGPDEVTNAVSKLS